MHRARRSLAIAAVVGTAITSACSRRANERSRVRWVGSGADLHLVGAGVFRYPVDTDFVERRRYVMQGRRLPGGFCQANDSASEVVYPEGLATFTEPVTLTVEASTESCIEVRAAGYYRNTRDGLPRWR
jgi:hypothetical protein